MRRFLNLLTRLVDQRDEAMRQNAAQFDLILKMRAQEAALCADVMRTAQMQADASKAQAQALGAYFEALKAGYATAEAQAAPPPIPEEAEQYVTDTYMSLFGPNQADPFNG